MASGIRVSRPSLKRWPTRTTRKSGLYEAEAHRLKGELLRAQGGIAATVAAETSFRLAIDVARRQSAKAWELRASTSLARLWREEHRPAEARHLLAGIYEWFKEGHDVPDLREARRLLGELALDV